VSSVRYLGAATRIAVDLDGTTLAALVPAGAAAPEQGQTAGLDWDPAALHLMEAG